MSTNETVNSTNNQRTTNYNTAKIAVWRPRFIQVEFTNSGYDDVTLEAGRLFGRIAATEKATQLKSTANDGSQFPLGILIESKIVEGGDTVQLNLVVEGDIAEEQVVLDEDDTFSTVISGKTLRDRIGSDTVGIKLVAGTELTNYDNN